MMQAHEKQDSITSTRKIIHIDMDCFYAAIEMRDHPALKNKPIAVGGSSEQRGVLCTANYKAREFGIHSAMATAYAKRRCPQLIVLPVNMQKYREVSQRIQAIFYQFTDLVEPLSLDEAYLDVTECRDFLGRATLIAKEIRQQIFKKEALIASAGIASNKMLAKIASDWRKPNGQFTITPTDAPAFLKALPVSKIFGVGKVTAKKLEALGIQTCADLQAFPINSLEESFGKFGRQLYYLSRGLDDRAVKIDRLRKSLSVEHTFPEDLPSLDFCLSHLPNLLENLKKRLAGSSDRCIHKQFVKVKFADFQQTSMECVSKTPSLEIYRVLTQQAYQRQNKSVRLLGLGVGFQERAESFEQEQLPLTGLFS